MSQARVIHINQPVANLPQVRPRQRKLTLRPISAYRDLHPAYLALVRNYARPLLFGPPVCDELIELVRHMFTPEEASVARHVKSLFGVTAERIAAKEQIPSSDARRILDSLADGKRVLFSYGKGPRKRYCFLPIVPGVFEMALVRTSLDSLTAWHRRFAELYSALFETGFFAQYGRYASGLTQFAPVRVSGGLQTALPADQLMEALDRYDDFAVGLCQCRMAERLVGRGCERLLESCIVFGDMAGLMADRGLMRKIDKKEMFEIKSRAVADGLASFISEVSLPGYRTGATCACCGCCCTALRTINDFNMPGLIAPPHFFPRIDNARCTWCGACGRACPVRALTVDAGARSRNFLQERCIGCGVCAAACAKAGAITMVKTRWYRKLSGNPLDKAIRMGPNFIRNAWRAWRKFR